MFAARVDKLAVDLPFSFSIIVKNGTMILGGERAPESRAQDIRALVEPFAQWLPDLQMYASDHDKGNIILGQDQYDAALELGGEGSCRFFLYLLLEISHFPSDFSDSQLMHYENLNRNHLPKLKSACHPYSNAVLGPPGDSNSSRLIQALKSILTLSSSSHLSGRSTCIHELLF